MYKFLIAATAGAAFALPAGAQVTGSRLPVQTGVQAEVRTGAKADAAADAQAQVETGVQTEAAGPETNAQAQSGAAADIQADANAAANSEAGAPAAAGPVVAATAADVRAGVQVLDPQGGVVGRVESVDAEGAVVSTGNIRAKMPISSFGKNARGLVISMTRAELEAAATARSPS